MVLKIINSIRLKRDPFPEFFTFLHHVYARSKGTGEPLSILYLKILKIFPLQIQKLSCILTSLCAPLSNGIWNLDLHLLVQTLVFLDHCGLASLCILISNTFHYVVSCLSHMESHISRPRPSEMKLTLSWNSCFCFPLQSYHDGKRK